MQTVSNLYREIFNSGDFVAETKLVINGVEYDQSALVSMSVTAGAFASKSAVIGCCVAKEINVVMLTPSAEIPRAAELKPYIRLVKGEQVTEWIPKGIYYIDTREQSKDAVSTLTLHGYDKMLMCEQPFCQSSEIGTWPRTDSAVISEICTRLGVSLDSRTQINHSYEVPFVGYGKSGMTIREVLGNIGAAYCGNFVFNDEGKLMLVHYGAAETYYLIDENENAIVFGGDRILVGSN